MSFYQNFQRVNLLIKLNLLKGVSIDISNTPQLLSKYIKSIRLSSHTYMSHWKNEKQLVYPTTLALFLQMFSLSFLQREVLFIGCLFPEACPRNISKSKYKLGTFFNNNVLGFRPIYLFSLSHRDGHRWLKDRKIYHLFCFSLVVFFLVFFSLSCSTKWYIANSDVSYAQAIPSSSNSFSLLLLFIFQVI